MKNQQLKALMAQQIANSDKSASEGEVKVLNNEELKITLGTGICLGSNCSTNMPIEPCPSLAQPACPTLTFGGL